jgi:ribosomal protein S17E
MKGQKVQVKYAGRIIQGFIDLLKENLQDIFAGDYENYLRKLCEALNLDSNKILQAYLNRTSILEPEDKTAPIIITTLLGELLSTIRERAFNETLQEIKNRFKKRHCNSNGNNQISDIDLDNRLSELFQRNDVNISLLYNLSFLEFIADTTHSQKVKRTARILLGKYMNRVVETMGLN